jgi:imidazole glycerol phosphate synthase subunit HisF
VCFSLRLGGELLDENLPSYFKLAHYQALTTGGASAVLAASLFHFGAYKIADVKNHLRERGLIVR